MAFDANAIYNNLLAEKPTMVHYEYYKGDYTSEHWVLIIGVRDGAQQNSLQYSDFTVIDPWGGAEKNLIQNRELKVNKVQRNPAGISPDRASSDILMFRYLIIAGN